MRKIIISLLSLLVIVTLGGCQSKFDPQSALKDSKEVLIEFLDSYEGKERLAKTYDKKTLDKFFTDENKDYFTENFKKNILSEKLDKLEFDSKEDFREIGKQFFFLAVTEEEKGIFWNEVGIKEDTINEERQAIKFHISSKSISRSSGYIEMVNENGEWKINNISEL